MSPTCSTENGSAICRAQQGLNLRLRPCEGRTLPLSYAPSCFLEDAYRIIELTATRQSGVFRDDDRLLRIARSLTAERERSEEDSECEREHRDVSEISAGAAGDSERCDCCEIPGVSLIVPSVRVPLVAAPTCKIRYDTPTNEPKM